MDEAFKQRLIAQGYYSEALVLDVVGMAYQAFILPGLTAAERWTRLYVRSYLIYCLWGEERFIPEAFRTRFGAARRRVSRTRHPRRPPAPNRRPRAVGIGRVVIAEDGTDLRFAKKCAQTRPAADRPG